jgi:hypothetical protein
MISLMLMTYTLPLSSKCAVPVCALVVMLHVLHRCPTLSYMLIWLSILMEHSDIILSASHMIW